MKNNIIHRIQEQLSISLFQLVREKIGEQKPLGNMISPVGYRLVSMTLRVFSYQFVCDGMQSATLGQIDQPRGVRVHPISPISRRVQI